VEKHKKYIKRCLQLAKNGLGTTRPNPMVGSVIVYNNKIIGEGYTSPYGGNHAEVNAINSVTDKALLNKATLYVSLEPCNHFGKTPPCSDLIVSRQIPRVVIGCIDPFDKVAGKGIEKLKKNGCEVTVGVLEEACIEMNRRFFTYHTQKRPYILLKWAETHDGFIDKIRTEKDSVKPTWISNRYARQLVHKWRSEEQGILIGTNTALLDNPKLDVRHWSGNSPVRIVLDRTGKIPKQYHLFDKRSKTIVFTEKKQKSTSKNILFKGLDFSDKVPQQLCDALYKLEIQSVFIEGGAQTLQSFIDADLWDEARIFIGDVSFDKGVKAPTIEDVEMYRQSIQKDVLKIIRKKH
jgi:diaminohydroxyphosphoribosylaminopyrimidine deaminase/5-amino-6-(5-phosphoribosylamino)uracil reductase